MPTEIHVPELGESVADTTVGRWLKQEGEAVKSGEALVELETDKINFEVEAEQDGVLESISKGEGETVNVGEVIGTLGEGDGNGTVPEQVAEQEDEEQEEQPQAEAEQPEPETEESGDETSNGHREVEAGAGRASPSVRKLAQEYEVDLAEVSGSGSGGRITRDDVERLIREQAHTADPEETPTGGPARSPERTESASAPTGRYRAESPGADGRGPGGAHALLQAAPDHRPEARRGTADRRDAHHLQRGGHDGDHGPPAAAQERVPRTKRWRTRHEMLRESLEIIRLLWSGGYHSYEGKHLALEDARVFDLPETPPLIAVASGGPASARLAAELGDAIFVTEPRTDITDAYAEAGGDGPRYAEVPLSWAPDEAEAARSAREAFRFGLTGWKVQSELPNPVNFEAATAFITEDDMRGVFGVGPDASAHLAVAQQFVDAGYDHLALINSGPDPEGFFDFFASELAEPLRELTPSS